MIVALHEGVDFLHQIVDAGERTPANGALGDDAKPTFHLIKPRGIGGRVVHLVARPLGQPIANLRMSVGGVVIDDEMDLVGWRNVLIEMPQEGEKLLMAVAGLACGEHLAVGDVQGGKQGGGAMANIIMGHAFDITQPHGQHGLGAVEGLNLALFVDAEHQGVIGWMQIQADNVAHLLSYASYLWDTTLGGVDICFAMISSKPCLCSLRRF